MPKKIKHRLVLHHLRRRHQSCKDDALLAPIDYIVSLIAKVKWFPTMSYRSSILVSRAYSLIAAALIKPSHLVLLLAAFGIPIMTSRLLRQEYFLLFFRKGSWQDDGVLIGFDGRKIRCCRLLLILLEQLLGVELRKLSPAAK